MLLDAPAGEPWPSLLAVGDALFGRLDWWPRVPPDAASTLIGALAGARRDVPGRPGGARRGSPTPGSRMLRTDGEHAPEIWCRLDGGPHGFLSIAAHAHADALSAEVRYGGVDVLADPGTYCYHGDPAWRSYFRSTIAHNTLEVAAANQSGRRRPVPLAAAGQRPRARGRRHRRRGRAGPPTTTVTWPCGRRSGTAARSGWTGRRA